MLALKIPDTRDFMKKILTQDIFDTFLLSEASVTTFTTWIVDGTWHPDYFSGDAPSALTWKMVRPLFFDIIKGRNTPASFRIVLKLADYNVINLLNSSPVSLKSEEVAGLFLNISYSGEELILTTGTSLKTFTLDKSLDRIWDGMILKFLESRAVMFTSLT